MSMINFLPLGSRTQGQVVKLNSVKSAKLGMYSTILSFAIVSDTALGKTFANRGFFGIMLTEKDPAGLLKVGDTVDCQIASYRESEYNGQSNTAAQVSFIAKTEVTPARVPLVAEGAATNP